MEVNPRPTPSLIKFAIWNIDSLLAREGSKLSLIESIDSLYKFDIFGICETYLTDSITDSQIEINGFSSTPLRADCKDITKRTKGGVCLYYKDHLPLKRRSDLEFLDECIVTEISLKRKKIFFVLLYRTPSQNRTQLSQFISNLQKPIDKLSNEKPTNIILTGDFNARSPIFWSGESKELIEGKILSDSLYPDEWVRTGY